MIRRPRAITLGVSRFRALADVLRRAGRPTDADDAERWARDLDSFDGRRLTKKDLDPSKRNRRSR